MFEDILRIIGVAIVGVILIIPPGEYLDILYKRENQIVVGLVVVASILFIDPIFGALLGLAVFIWFFKMNYRKIVSSSLSSGRSSTSPIVYGTQQNLEDAQTNVVDRKMFNTEMIGFDGVHGEQVIGAQGLDRAMPGYDKKDINQASVKSTY